MTKPKISPFSSIAQFFASGFGSGCAPFAPGTIGTLMALPLWWGLSYLPPLYYFLAVVFLSLIGIWFCDTAAKELKVHDHGGIVWDEFMGLFITLFLLKPTLVIATIGFFIFRLFDILKPWPISYIDKHVEGGFGIMLDDILAGLFGFIAMQTLVYLGVI